MIILQNNVGSEIPTVIKDESSLDRLLASLPSVDNDSDEDEEYDQQQQQEEEEQQQQQPVKGKRGRKPGTKNLKVDMKSKLERSRQSARECRARKKLR